MQKCYTLRADCSINWITSCWQCRTSVTILPRFFFPFVWAEQKLLKKKLFVWKRPNCRWVQTIREMTTEIWRSMPALDGGRWLRSAVAARFMKMTSASTFTAWRHIWRRTFLLNGFQVINLENGARDNKEERPSCVYWLAKIWPTHGHLTCR